MRRAWRLTECLTHGILRIHEPSERVVVRKLLTIIVLPTVLIWGYLVINELMWRAQLTRQNITPPESVFQAIATETLFVAALLLVPSLVFALGVVRVGGDTVCQRCGYPAPDPAGPCPECGQELDAENGIGVATGRPWRPRARWWAVAVLAALATTLMVLR